MSALMTRKSKIEPYGLASIDIAHFRNMENLTIPLGQRITVLAGQNGTSKSTILGMLGQPFGTERVTTIFGKTCKTKFTDIFNMSPQYDVPGEHLYYVNFRDTAMSGGKQHIQVKSYSRTVADRSHIRLVTGATRKRGEGNIDHPVIYLGMRRVYPIGEIANPEATNPELTPEETENFITWYSRIMVPGAPGGITPIKMTKRGQKETLLVNSGKYDFLANSAGQDNLGQILAALISFQRAKANLGEDYHGGLLLIDEIDATLFPASQLGLFDVLYNIAPDLKLQIALTTHSTDLIEHALRFTKRGDDVEVIYLRTRGERIIKEENPSMDSVRSDLLISPLPPEKKLKVEVWCEDDEAAWFLRRMLPRQLAAKCSIKPAGLSCGELGELAIRDSIPAIRNVLFVTDADGVRDAPKKIKECSRLFVLPGNDSSPERSIYELLDEMPDDDPRWSEFNRGYRKQQFKRHRQEIEDEHKRDGGKVDRRLEKKWFAKTKRDGLWGTNGADIYAIWSKVHEGEIVEFCSKLERRIDAVLRRVSFEASKE